MNNKEKITFDWLKRYTGTDPGDYGDWILLTNFQNYVEKFANKFTTKINGLGGPMTSAINKDGLSIINFGIGSANAATIMDLLSCIKPKGVLFLGKCGGLKKTTDIGHFFCLQHRLEVKVQVMTTFLKKFLQCPPSSFTNMFRNYWLNVI